MVNVLNIFDPTTALGILSLVSMEQSALCQIPKPTEINVRPRTEEIKYVTSQTLAELQQYNIDTINPYGFDSDSKTHGFMRGQISMQPKVVLDYKYVLANQGVCIWYDKIDINIAITPEIFIAKEVAADPCQYKATKEHELKHVAVDRQIVNKYAKSMGKKLYNGLKSRGFSVGPVRADAAQQIINRMQQTVVQLIEFEYRKMELERTERQQAVDSLEEYERVSNACPKKAVGASRRRR